MRSCCRSIHRQGPGGPSTAPWTLAAVVDVTASPGHAGVVTGAGTLSSTELTITSASQMSGLFGGGLLSARRAKSTSVAAPRRHAPHHAPHHAPQHPAAEERKESSPAGARCRDQSSDGLHREHAERAEHGATRAVMTQRGLRASLPPSLPAPLWWRDVSPRPAPDAAGIQIDTPTQQASICMAIPVQKEVCLPEGVEMLCSANTRRVIVRLKAV